jgi:hypothetical protein
MPGVVARGAGVRDDTTSAASWTLGPLRSSAASTLPDKARLVTSRHLPRRAAERRTAYILRWTRPRS